MILKVVRIACSGFRVLLTNFLLFHLVLLSQVSFVYFCSTRRVASTLFVSRHQPLMRNLTHYIIVLTFSLHLGTYTDVAIWTSIEPSVGLVSCCLPTLRPLLQALRKKAEHIWIIVRSIAVPTQHDHGIQLESGDTTAQKVKLSGRARWIDNNSLDLSSNQNLSRGTTIGTSVGGSNSERDDVLLMGVNVRHDVRVEHSPL